MSILVSLLYCEFKMSQAEGSTQSREQQALSGLRVLLVEDDAKIRSVIAMVLRRIGSEVFQAGDGVEAFEIIQRHHRAKTPMEYVVTDLMMPRMNGIGLLRLIRDNIHFGDMPVAIVSGLNEERERTECEALGIDGFIPKPLKVASLVNHLVDAIHERQDELKRREDSQTYFPDESELGFPYRFKGFIRTKTYPLAPSYYRCPFCEATFIAPRLVNRAMRPDYSDKLGIGIYREGFERDYVEYPLIEALVCPKCLYTSDKIGFYKTIPAVPTELFEIAKMPTKEWEPIFFDLTERLQHDFRSQLQARVAIAKGASDHGKSLFKLSQIDPTIPRSHSDALVALDLAINSTEFLKGQLAGETDVRLRHKTASYMLKKFYIYGLMSKKSGKDKDKLAYFRNMRISSMEDALRSLMDINDVEFNVLEERLYCLTRRFFLSDMLALISRVDTEIIRFAKIRKDAIGAMKAVLIRARQAKSAEIKTIERFLIPLETRMYEISNKSKK